MLLLKLYVCIFLFHLYYKSEILLLFRAMKEIWLEKYRPKKLSDVFGNT